MNDNLYVALEIGSFITKLVVSKINDERQMPIGIVTVKTKGVYNNKIKNQKHLIETIKKAIFKMKSEYQINVTSVSLVINSDDIMCLQETNEISFDKETSIEGQHLKKLEINLYNKINENNNEILVTTLIPAKFTINDSLTSTFPIGLKANKINCLFNIYGVQKDVIYPYIDAVEKSGLKAIHILPSVIASSYSALNQEEVQAGTCILDIGSDSTTLTVFKNKKIDLLYKFNFGSHYISQIIESSLRCTYDEAEIIKRTLLSTIPIEELKTNATAIQFLETYNSSLQNLKALVEKVHNYATNFLQDVKNFADVNINPNNFSYYVFIGGGSEIFGLCDYAESILEKKCYVYQPENEGLKYSIYTNIVGTIYYTYITEMLFGESYNMAEISIGKSDYFSKIERNNTDLDVESKVKSKKQKKNKKQKKGKKNEKSTNGIFGDFFD